MPVNAAPTAKPAPAPSAPAATALPVLPLGVVDDDVVGVEGGVAVSAVAEGGNTLVLLPVPLGRGGGVPSTIGAGSVGGRDDVPGVFLLAVSLPIAAGVVGNCEGMDCPGRGGRASKSSSLSMFEPVP